VGATDVTLTLAMRPALSASGQIVFEGQKPQPAADQIKRYVVGFTGADGRSTGALFGRDPGADVGYFKWVDMAAGRYVFRTSSVPSGWSLKSATRGGEDIIDVPIDFTNDISTFIVTFTDQPTRITGSVRQASGAADTDAFVIIFPANPQRWVDAGRQPIRMRGQRVPGTGTFTIAGLPPGDYFLAAIAEASASTWQSPKFLDALSRQATRVRLDVGTTLTQDLKRVEVR